MTELELEPDEPVEPLEPVEEEPEPLTEPALPGRYKVTPFDEKTTLPFLSVRYTVIPAEESRLSAEAVG